ncbi:MAG TPA: methyltransferase [Acidimicrobiales bacterium]|nr:methyltransferase [Acidimicrobiales bacterium]
MLQSVFFLALLGSPLIDRHRPPAAARLLGLGLFTGGVGVAVAGYRELGKSHSPWTTPTAAGLVTSGIYSRIRHPIYAGWCLGSLGLEVLAGSRLGVGVVGGLMVFYDLKAREEDRLLVERYSGGAGYRSAVNRFIPGVY